MDEQFIRMADCPEIQDAKVFVETCDRVAIKLSPVVGVDHLVARVRELRERRKNEVWLPTQAQLQEMVGEEYTVNLLYEFHDFYNVRGCDLYPNIIASPGDLSMEQLWLAFVMHRLHSRVWNGNEWEAA